MEALFAKINRGVDISISLHPGTDGIHRTDILYFVYDIEPIEPIGHKYCLWIIYLWKIKLPRQSTRLKFYEAKKLLASDAIIGHLLSCP